LEKAGFDPAVVEECLQYRDRLANLQLLEGVLNVIKSDSTPAVWLPSIYPDQVQRQAAMDRHDLGSAPADALEFLDFYKNRRERIRQRLADLLSKGGIDEGSVTGEPSSSEEGVMPERVAAAGHSQMAGTESGLNPLQLISKQAHWIFVKGQFGNANDYDSFKKTYSFDPNSRIARTGISLDEVLKPHAEKRREIFEKCLLDGLTVQEVNDQAREMKLGAKLDADIFVGLYKDYIRLAE
jgi:hypothetical protein